MLDLHTHSVFSDGSLIPAELARRAKFAGYSGIAVTDHVDSCTISWVLENLVRGLPQMAPHLGMDLFAGVELTHVPPALIGELTEWARNNGASLVVVHGETLVEPVAEGTNLAAVEEGVDILAHPGLISREEAELAAERGVALEISTRKGHCLANGHVAQMARACGAPLVINNDAHDPSDFVERELRKQIARGAGLTQEEIHQAESCSRRIADRILLDSSRGSKA
jgi:histidinol phosphatase-like PHP family hydrolase